MMFYRFHADTHEFVGARVAPIDPLESDRIGEAVYAQPGLYDTTTAPPEVGEKQAAVFANGAWSVVPDHRGETWWRSYTESYIVEDLGTPEGTATKPDAPPPTQQELIAYAAAKRYDIETGGLISAAFGQLATDRDTRGILGQAIQLIDLGIIAAPIRFKAPSGFTLLDRAALVAISTEIAAHVQVAFDIEDEVIGKVLNGAITSKAQIDAENWPGS